MLTSAPEIVPCSSHLQAPRKFALVQLSLTNLVRTGCSELRAAAHKEQRTNLVARLLVAWRKKSAKGLSPRLKLGKRSKKQLAIQYT